MQVTGSRNTKCELALRSALHRRGLRFRVHESVEPSNKRYKPDIVFRRAKVVVYVDGCFWHACPVHGTSAKWNRGWWEEKLRRNAVRDTETNRRLTAEGWTVIRVWEHVDPDTAADAIIAILRYGQTSSDAARVWPAAR